MDAQETRLLAEQISRAFDQVGARMDLVDARLAHVEELLTVRLDALDCAQVDQEQRLRKASEAVVVLSTRLSIYQALQAAFSLALSAAATWLGAR